MLKFFSRRKGEKGFTLIELLVVIAIIGILATIVLVSLNNARQKARDTRRLGDLRQVALALEMYADDNSAKYPGDDANEAGCDEWSDLETALEPNYMSSVPTDPGVNTYTYEAASNQLRYVLAAKLENEDNQAFDNDVDGTPYGCACDDIDPTLGYCIQP